MNTRIPKILAISERRTLTFPFSDWIDQLIAAGVDALQIREKDLSDNDLLELARTARQTLERRKRAGNRVPKLLINGRIDIALASGADGVHLPAQGLPVEALRQRFGSEPILGVSTHHPDEVARAQQAGADYVTFGPVYPTPSKAAYGPPPGLDGLREASRHGLPVIALGGISPERAAEVQAHGAWGFAGIRMFQDLELLQRLPQVRETWERTG